MFTSELVINYFHFRISSLNKGYETIKSENPNSRSSIIYCSHGKNAKICCGNLEVSLELDSPDESKENSMSNQRLDKLVLSHCHSLTTESGVDRHARKRLIFASILCVVFMIGEVVGGFLANSLAIATDAAHLLTDFASFMISLFALWMASRPATRSMNFGW